MATIKANTSTDGKVVSYRVRACVGRDAKGKQVFVTKTMSVPEGLTPAKALKRVQQDAAEWEAKCREDFENGIDTRAKERQTFKAFYEEEFIPVHVMNGEHTPSTITFYKQMGNRLIERFGSMKLTAIKPLDIEKFFIELRNTTGGKGKPLSAKTIKHYQRTLTALFNFAETHDAIDHNPMDKVKPVKVPTHDIDFLDEDQVKQFLAAVEADAAPIWQTMMYLLLNTGLRRGECCGLQWQDIDFQNKTLTVVRNVTHTQLYGVTIGKPKTEKSHRTLPLTMPVINALKKWQEEQARMFKSLPMPKAFVFCALNPPDLYSPIAPDSVTRWLKRFEETHNLPNMSVHDLRHTAASLLILNGANIKAVQTMLGHSSAETTLNFYAGISDSSLRDAAECLTSAING